MRLVVPVLLVAFVSAGQQTPSPAQQAQSTTQNGTAGNVSRVTAANATGQSQPAAPSASNSPAKSSQSSSAPNASSEQTPVANPPVLKVTTRLVLVDVVVTDGYGRPVTDLKQADFDVKENGKAQKIVAFAFQPPPPPPVAG